ncbi:YdeI/OmpD-associated family protein [Lentzea sp. BCCO 10_0061]|uniref:YdeI/OmpD-associated family protein n=1 Tax=Lentzea sokolovensis TaxID=3095429 RepID=A0ABU4V1B0_9PSEU|nr:YdeI/OmpD-associated family protein [Lentzea sp. BCCO 10_0061]MDX8145570.1 YdeI/OmpD-associated family protein [Lentzea sp. BCCO 10_0061]
MIVFEGPAEFDAWLHENGANETELWLKYAKKGSGIKTITYGEALDVALCHGWIDGLTRSVDETWYSQRWTPRRPKSKWSKRNCGKVEELIAAGKMLPAGLNEIEKAKADGRWDAAYAGPATIEVPDDLTEALKANPKAAEFFKTLNSQNRYAVLLRIHDAKRPETRQKRIAQFVEMLAEGRKLYS